ncbi:MAG TPA: CAP domain-containing protein [Bacillota bacterium]|nr:CAP domain-containing protein [Bacillota bacterium]
MFIIRRYVVFGLILIGFFILAGCSEQKQTSEVDPQKVLSPIELQAFEKINDYRRDKGLQPLAVDERIINQARIHSRNMGNGVTPFGHEGFNERVNASGVNFKTAAENVAYNQGYNDPAANAVEGWIKSEGHRKNIEGDYNLTGMGVFQNDSGRYYFTQLFMKTDGDTNNIAPNQPQNKGRDPLQDFFSQFKFW